MNLQHLVSSKKGLLLILLLVSSTGTLKPINDLGKVILGGLGIAGGMALVHCAWNSNYDDAQRCIDGAHESVLKGKDFYGGMLQKYQPFYAINLKEFESTYIPYIKQLHAKRGYSFSRGLQDKYSALWFVNRVQKDISDYSARIAELSDLAQQMQSNRSYYGSLYDQCLSEIKHLTSMHESLGCIEGVASLSDTYCIQKEMCQLKQDEQKIREFKTALASAQSSVENKYRRFMREYDALHRLDQSSYQFEAFLETLIPAKHSEFYCGVSLQYNFATLWYLSDIKDAVAQLNNTKSLLHRNYNVVKTVASYHGTLDHEYTTQIRRINDLIDLLSRIKDRLPSLSIYIADQQRYDCQLREQQARARERQARQRELDAWDREQRAAERERQARVREKKAAARDREERARDRERRAAERERKMRVQQQEAAARQRAERAAKRERQARIRERERAAQERERINRVREREAKALDRQAQVQERERRAELHIDVVGGW